MSAKIAIIFALIALLAVQSFGRRFEEGREHGGEGLGEKMMFEYQSHRNASCIAPAISQPGTPACTTCICYPDNVLNCWTLKARFCNSTTTTTTTTTTAAPA